jgi:hypothetical protein
MSGKNENLLSDESFNSTKATYWWLRGKEGHSARRRRPYATCSCRECLFEHKHKKLSKITRSLDQYNQAVGHTCKSNSQEQFSKRHCAPQSLIPAPIVSTERTVVGQGGVVVQDATTENKLLAFHLNSLITI